MTDEEKATRKAERDAKKADKVADAKTKDSKKVADKNPTVRPEPAPVKTVKKVDKATEKAAAGEDKIIGKDDKGRTIYEGPRGGRYYINSNGNKTYTKKDA